MLMLTIFHHPRTETFCLASFLVRKKTLTFKKAHQTKDFYNDEKLSASAQGQAMRM
jgi:hypothetical protein